MKLIFFSITLLFFASCASTDDNDNSTVPANAPIESTGATTVTNPPNTDSIVIDSSSEVHSK